MAKEFVLKLIIQGSRAWIIYNQNGTKIGSVN